MVLLSSNEGEPIDDIKRDPVRILDSRQFVSADNLHGGWVDRHQLVGFVNSHEDVPRAGIVDGITCAASERNRGDQLVRLGIDYSINSAMLVRNKYPLRCRGVCQPIGIVDRTDCCEDLQALHVHGNHLMFSGCRRKHTIRIGNCNHSMDTFEPVEIRDHLSLLYVKDNELVRIHVRDVESSTIGIEALIVEPDGWTW